MERAGSWGHSWMRWKEGGATDEGHGCVGLGCSRSPKIRAQRAPRWSGIGRGNVHHLELGAPSL